MNLKLNVDDGEINYDFNNLSPEQVHLIKKSLIANWGSGNFSDDTEERLCLEMIDDISTVYYVEKT